MMAVEAQAASPGEPEFRNPYRGRRTAMLAVAGACLILVAIDAILLATIQLDTRDGAGMFVAVSLVIGIVGAVAMLLLALVMGFVVRATDGVFARFRRGELVADWSYKPQEWEPFLKLEKARYDKGAWGIPFFIVIPIGFVVATIAFSLASDSTARLRNLALAAAGDAALYWILTRVGSAMSRSRVAMLRRNPRVLIGNDAIYFGGVLAQWNYGGTRLQSIQTIAGSPMRLEVRTGAGAKPNSGKYDFTTLLLIPIPAAREDEAGRVVQTLRPVG